MTATTARSDLFIGGAWSPPVDGRRIEVVSPHTEQVVVTVAGAGPADVDRAVEAARQAFDRGPWPRTTPEERIGVVRELAAGYARRRREMAALITTEMGSPITFAERAQVGLPLATMGGLCDVAEAFPWTERRPGAFGGEVLLRREPVGVVAAVVPWNVPQFLIVSKLVPALLAGCCVVVKPAPETPLDALLLAELIEETGLPPGVVSFVPGGAEVGERLVSHPGVDKVAFTGSTEAGRRVARACADGLKRVTFELGGKSAAIALDDADPEAVASAVAMASLSNSGQLCNALTRVLVPADRSGEFVDALASVAAGLRVGDPEDPATQVGPLVSRRQQERVLGYLRSGLADGARVVVGGVDAPPGCDRGWYVRPTVLADVDNAMAVAREEIFGPVVCVLTHQGDADAVRMANDSEYGLAGAVWTGDPDRGLAVAAGVRVGTFGVNRPFSPDPAAPLGGMKASGYGRELGREGLEAYVEVQSVSVG